MSYLLEKEVGEIISIYIRHWRTPEEKRKKRRSLHELSTTLNTHERNTDREREEIKRTHERKKIKANNFITGHQRTVMSVYWFWLQNVIQVIKSLSFSFSHETHSLSLPPSLFKFLLFCPLRIRVVLPQQSQTSRRFPSAYLTPICSKPKLLPFFLRRRSLTISCKDSLLLSLLYIYKLRFWRPVISTLSNYTTLIYFS